MSVLAPILDLVYPRSCLSCGLALDADPDHVCWDCLRSFELIGEPFCEQCGDPVDGNPGGPYTCSACHRVPPHFDRARSAVRYRAAAKTVLHAFKYTAATWAQADLVRFLQACVTTHYTDVCFDGIVPVPLFPARERERTYNQSTLLAAGLSRALSVPLLTRCCHRQRLTATQTRLSAPQRRRNVRGAFEVTQPGWIEGRAILLVDDVMTTGATVAEVSRVLKKAGASGVFVVTVARG